MVKVAYELREVNVYPRYNYEEFKQKLLTMKSEKQQYGFGLPDRYKNDIKTSRYCNFSDEFILQPNEYELLSAMRQMYENYKQTQSKST